MAKGGKLLSCLLRFFLAMFLFIDLKRVLLKEASRDLGPLLWFPQVAMFSLCLGLEPGGSPARPRKVS